MTDEAAGISTSNPRIRVQDPDGDPHATIAGPTVPQRLRAPRAANETVPVEIADEVRVSATLERLPRLGLELGPGPWTREDHEEFPRESSKDTGTGAGADADLVLTGVLGQGGMGRVLLAHQQSLRRDVAVKVLHAGLEYGSLLAEARLAGQLEHPHIVPVHALGRDANNRPVLVLKRIEGVRWKELLSDPEHPFWERVPSARIDRLLAHVQILMQVCNALHFAHSRGVVHRDVKPDNVMIGAFGEVYVTDWGVATRSARLGAPASQTTGASTGREIVGTPAYMAPEMLFGDADTVDARTDVFLLGATLHEVLTGETRHGGRSVKAALEAAYTVRPYAYPPEVPAELAAAANRATRGDPDARFASAQELHAALASWVEHRGATALSVTATQRLDELRALLAPTPGGIEPDAASVHRLVTECRFGFREALRAWPDQPAAIQGLRATLELALGHEISRGDVSAARSVLAEIDAAGQEVPTDLRARFQALRDADERTRARAAELERLAHEMDLSTGARERRVLFGTVAVACGTLGLFFFLSRFSIHPGPLEYSRLLVLPTIWIFAIVGAMLGWRGQLMANTANRRASGLVALGMTAVVLHRIAGLRLGMPPESVIMGDNLLMAGVTAGTAITVNPRLWPAPAAYLAAFAMTLILPVRTLGFFMGASTVLLVTLMRAIVFLPKTSAPR